RLVTGGADGTIRVWGAPPGRPAGCAWQFDMVGVAAVALSPDGKRLLAVEMSRQLVQLRDTATGEVVGSPMRHEGDIIAGDFTPNGDCVARGGPDRGAGLGKPTDGPRRGEPLQHEESVTMTVFRPDSKAILTASGGTARLWEVPTGKPLSP